MIRLQNKQWQWGWGLVSGLLVVLASPAWAAAATLTLSPATGSHAVGDSFEVKIQLNTSGVATSGTDADLTYDPNVLQIVDANSSIEGAQISAGSLYSQTTYNLANNTTGKLSFSGTQPAQSPGYSGSGTLATITFEAIKEVSATAVSLDFTKGSTSDSGVFDKSSQDDVLSSVTNASYSITAAADTTDTTGDGGASGTAGNGTGAAGDSGTDGTGGSATVAGTGIDLAGYLALTLISLAGAGYFLSRRPKIR